MKLQLWVGSGPASWAAVTLSVPVSVNALPDAGLTSVIVPSAAGLTFDNRSLPRRSQLVRSIGDTAFVDLLTLDRAPGTAPGGCKPLASNLPGVCPPDLSGCTGHFTRMIGKVP